MPSIIRKSDGKVFDVFGLMKLDLREQFVFLVWDMGRWQWAGVSEFEPAPFGPGKLILTGTDEDLEPILDHDPDLEAQ